MHSWIQDEMYKKFKYFIISYCKIHSTSKVAFTSGLVSKHPRAPKEGFGSCHATSNKGWHLVESDTMKITLFWLFWYSDIWIWFRSSGLSLLFVAIPWLISIFGLVWLLTSCALWVSFYLHLFSPFLV